MIHQLPSHRKTLGIEPLEDRSLLAAGFLDPTFAGDGMVATNVGLTDWSDSAYDAAVYPGSTPATDGKIVVVGQAATKLAPNGMPGSDYDFALVRYNPDGSLDAGFGQGGKVTTAFGTRNDRALSVELVGNKIVAAGFSENGGFAVARYHDNGSLDATFGSKGKVLTKISGGGLGLAMKVDASSRPVMAGVDGVGVLTVVRYTTSGGLDKTFGKGGIVSNPAIQPGPGVAPMDVAITPASAGAALFGKIVVASGNVVARYTTSGALDASFGVNGLSTLPTGSGRYCSVAVQSDGRMVVASGAGLFRLSTNGSLDASLDGDGQVTVGSESMKPSSVAIQDEGKIMLTGLQATDDFKFANLFVARYLPDGALDPTFGNSGIGHSTDGSVDWNSYPGIALSNNGKVIVMGKNDILTASGHVSDFVVARFDEDAALHASAMGPNPTTQALNASDLHPLLDEAMARWQTAGVDTSALYTIDLRIADLGGATLGLALGNTIWLDDNAAGWGWFVDPTPGDDDEFTTLGDQGEQNRMDLLSVLAHELGHLLGFDHSEPGASATGDVMLETLAAGTRQMPAEPDGTLPFDRLFAEAAQYETWFLYELFLAESDSRRRG